MRAVFAGTAEFSVPSLRVTADRCDVVAVVTQPDRLGSRGRPAPRPVADCARDLGLPVLHLARVRDATAIAEILAYAADVLVVAAYGQILPVELMQGHRLGGVNVHASLLPRWRGAAPIAAAILHGDVETGVSIMRIEEGLDTGAVYATRAIPIPERATTLQLGAELASLGSTLLGEILDELAKGDLVHPEVQDDTQATYAPRLGRDDGRVDWRQCTASDVDRMVRALNPWPGVTALLAAREVRICAGEVLGGAKSPESPGAILLKGHDCVDVATASGVFRISEVQPPGARRMTAAAYLRGLR